ncbi:purine phosphoribosyltransferase family protein, partial [Paenibacillus zanthoxyli]
MDFKEIIRVIPDFPQPGISFKDITTLLKDGEMYRGAIDALKERVAHLKIDVIAGPEARGFVIGAPLAYALGVGFVPIRKSGKLPY